MEKCYFCKSKLTKERVNHIHRWGEKMIFFENVEAEVCKQCGETYFPPESLALMDEKTRLLSTPEKTISIPLVTL
ncbi:MAG: YgiT-type zinc finger protein [Acidobacteriota bacterium]|nr:YgiT-type zinc finger protein [Acidobacteriota bacterium]